MKTLTLSIQKRRNRILKLGKLHCQQGSGVITPLQKSKQNISKIKCIKSIRPESESFIG